MNPGEIPRGDYLLYDVRFGRRTIWVLGHMPDALRELEADRRLQLFEIAKRLIACEGVSHDAAALGYTRSRNGPAQFRNRIHRALVAEGLQEMADAFAWCLDLEDGAITFRVRAGIRFFTRRASKTSAFVYESSAAQRPAIQRPHENAAPVDRPRH